MSGTGTSGWRGAGPARWAAVAVPTVLLIGFGSARSVAAGDGDPWYAALAKPAGTPPGWLFPVAWTVVYLCMGLALATVLGARGAAGRRRGAAAFAATLALAAAWMPVFFGAHRVGAALWVAVAMVASGSLTAVLFGRVAAHAARLMLPFLAWTGYAAALTAGIHRLNPGAAALAPAPAASQLSGPR